MSRQDGGDRRPLPEKAKPEPVEFRRDLQEVKRDIYENFRVLVAVAIHGAFYIAWVGIMILIHWVIGLMGSLDYPANIIPEVAEGIAQLGVLYITASHTYDFALELTAHNRAKKARRAEKVKNKDDGEPSAATGAG
jgi:hypothetical protein